MKLFILCQRLIFYDYYLRFALQTIEIRSSLTDDKEFQLPFKIEDTQWMGAAKIYYHNEPLIKKYPINLNLSMPLNVYWQCFLRAEACISSSFMSHEVGIFYFQFIYFLFLLFLFSEFKIHGSFTIYANCIPGVIKDNYIIITREKPSFAFNCFIVHSHK